MKDDYVQTKNSMSLVLSSVFFIYVRCDCVQFSLCFVKKLSTFHLFLPILIAVCSVTANKKYTAVLGLRSGTSPIAWEVLTENISHYRSLKMLDLFLQLQTKRKLGANGYM